MNKFKLLLSCGVLLGVSACASDRVQVFQPIDTTQKTMTLPAGNLGIMGAIKQRLTADGWKLYVDGGPARADEVTNGNHKVTTAGITYKSRYRLEANQQFINDSCIGSGGPVVFYELSLIDNRSGEEVMAQSGRSCTNLVAEKFVQAIDNPPPTP